MCVKVYPEQRWRYGGSSDCLVANRPRTRPRRADFFVDLFIGAGMEKKWVRPPNRRRGMEDDDRGRAEAHAWVCSLTARSRFWHSLCSGWPRIHVEIGVPVYGAYQLLDFRRESSCRRARVFLIGYVAGMVAACGVPKRGAPARAAPGILSSKRKKKVCTSEKEKGK